jgi:putative transposase
MQTRVSQVTSRAWQSFSRQRNPQFSMSRRGICHDNTVAQKFFWLNKRDRTRRRMKQSRYTARHNVFEHIDVFYTPKRTRRRIVMLSPVHSDIRQQKLNQAGVRETGGTSGIRITGLLRGRFGTCVGLRPL